MALLHVARRVLVHSVRKQGTWGRRPWQLKQPVDLISSHSWAGNSGSLQLNPRHYLLTPAYVKLDSTVFNSIQMKIEKLNQVISPARTQWYGLVRCLFLLEFNDFQSYYNCDELHMYRVGHSSIHSLTNVSDMD